MCGIAGIFDGSGAVDADALETVNAALTHRGPDDAGTFFDGPVGLAHRRLSIIDPEGGTQPLFNEDGSVAVVFNGEIYNHRTVRTDLVDAGHRFETDADTEVLVHAYEEYGLAFLDRLEGMFAFALWDGDAERLLLARDPMGIKPLFVANDGDAIAFASELSAILESSIDPGALRREAIAQYFAFGFVPAPLTAFTDVSRLRPGERALVTADGIERERYATPTIQSRNPSMATAASGVRERVETAVEDRLMSDVPLGAFLSGGIDSSIIVGVMAELLGEPVKTFTVGFEEGLFDESWAAQEVAEYHDTDHTTVTVTPDTVRETVPEVLDRLGEPFADPSLIPTSVVARETSRDVKIALSGDGADELFAGYEKYRGEYLSHYYRAVPSPVRTSLLEPAVNALPASRGDGVGEFARKLKKFTRGGDPDLVTRHRDWLRLPDDRAVEGVADLDPMAVASESLAHEHEDAAALLPRNRQDDLSRMLAVDTRYVLPNQMLRKVDRASMYNSLEVRVPFLDVDVVEHALSLPIGQKISTRERKRVLKRAFEDILPESILKRDKQGFDMPIGEWLKGPLADEFQRLVRTVEDPYLDGSETLSIHEEHCTGRRDHEKFCWNVYVYLRWIRRMREQGILHG